MPEDLKPFVILILLCGIAIISRELLEIYIAGKGEDDEQ